MWRGFKSPNCDIRVNPFASLGDGGGAAICAFTYTKGGEESLHKLMEMITSIPFPQYEIDKAVMTLLEQGLAGIADVTAGYVNRPNVIPANELRFCATNVKFMRKGERCKNPDTLCGQCFPI